jgi:hypothetical protein
MNSYSREYGIWSGMRQRCTNPNAPNYNNYGARGITVCERWKKFSNFWQDMGPVPSPQHTLNRKDNNKGYFPENCEWAPPERQQNNRRNNVFIEAFGKRQTIAQWARAKGLSRDMIRHRILVMKMSPEEALIAPRMSHRRCPVEQLSLDGQVVCCYDSLADVQKIGGFSKGAVYQVLCGKAKTSAGFRWRYVTQEPSSTNHGTS